MKHTAEVHDGKAVWDDKDKLFKQLDKLEWKKISVDIKAVKDNRSIRQNRFYWGYILWNIHRHMQENWYNLTPDDLHWYFKVVLCSLLTDDEFDEITTAWMDSRKFTRYIENIKDHVLEKFWLQIRELWEQELLQHYDKYLCKK